MLAEGGGSAAKGRALPVEAKRHADQAQRIPGHTLKHVERKGLLVRQHSSVARTGALGTPAASSLACQLLPVALRKHGLEEPIQRLQVCVAFLVGVEALVREPLRVIEAYARRAKRPSLGAAITRYPSEHS